MHNTPFGYRRADDRLVEGPTEQAALREAVRLDGEGESYRAVGRMLVNRGVQPHRGASWHACSVRAVLRSKIAQERPATA